MMKFILLPICLLAACTERNVSDPDMESSKAQLRGELFRDCLARLPKGPRQTRYNDWDEVVQKCDDIAYYQANQCRFDPDACSPSKDRVRETENNQ